ncbi:MAG: tetratricopeptide repeat protein [Planctomycetes bacterium]|nr:tetratricopeptide repeat protein [Planctomycetota bacterium]
MTQGTQTDYGEILLGKDLAVQDVVSLRRRVSSSNEEKAAFKEFCRSIETETDPAYKLAQAVGLWISGAWKDARVAALDAGGGVVAGYIAGRCCLALGELSAAADAFREIAPKAASGEVYALLSRALRRSHDYSGAAAAVKEGLKLFPKNAQILAEAGILDDISGDSQKAEERYREALEIEPDCVDALFRLGFLCDLHGDNDAAVDFYQSAVQAKPVHTRALTNLGLLYEELGRQKEAVGCFALVARSHPTDRRAGLYLKDGRASQDMYFDEDLQKRRERRNKILETAITDFELSVRSRNCLEKMNVTTLGDLTRISEQELLLFKNFGETSLTEIKQMMATKNLCLGQALEEGGKKPGAEIRPASRKIDDKSRLLEKPVDELGLSIRSQHCMQTLGIETIGDLVSKSEKVLLEAKNFGATSLYDIRKKLAARGLSLKE